MQESPPKAVAQPALEPCPKANITVLRLTDDNPAATIRLHYSQYRVAGTGGKAGVIAGGTHRAVDDGAREDLQTQILNRSAAG